jgi:type IV secretory pathway VirB2 component (pilin)
MQWLKGLIQQWQDIGKAVFALIIIFGAIKNMFQHRMLAILLFLIAAAILGWIVNDYTNASQKLTDLLNAGSGG